MADETRETRMVTITRSIPDSLLTDEQIAERLVAHYGHRNPQTLYGQYVRARALKPNVDAKAFGAMLAAATPNPHYVTETIPWSPTHHYVAVGIDVMITPSEQPGVWRLCDVTGRINGTTFTLDGYVPLEGGA